MRKPTAADTGYVFAVDDPGNPLRIVTTSGVVEIVSFGGQPVPIPEAQLEALERIAAPGLPVTRCRYTLPDQTVELMAGPLRGMQGVLVRQANATCLAVGFGPLQCSVMVEIDGTWAPSSS